MPNWKKVIVSGSDASLNSLGIGTNPVVGFGLYVTNEARLIGTNEVRTDNAQSSLYTLNLTRTTVGLTSQGNVGIKNSNPLYELDVSGSIRATGSVFFPGLTNTPQTNIVTFNPLTGQLYYVTSSTLTLSGGTTNVVPLWTSPTTLGASVISQSSNYIGINTSPSTYLHVRESVNTGVEGFYITNWNNTTTVKLGSDTSTGGAKLLLNNNAGTTNISLTSYANNYISGSLGIGVVSPAYKLDVDGDARIATTLTAIAVTASLFGTSSWSQNSLTASFVTSSNVRGPHGFNSVLSSSFAITSSFAINTLSASLAQTASFITASNIFGPHGASSVLSSSFAVSSSFTVNSLSASLAQTASFVTGSNVFGPHGSNSVLSSSFAVSSSFTVNSLSASLAQTASFVTASNVRGPHGFNSVLSSSYAISASFVTSASFATTAANIPGGTNNRIALWNSATTLSSSLLLQSPGIVTAYGLLASYTEQTGAGTNLIYLQNRDTTAAVTHQTRFGTQQLGGGIARTLLYAAAPDTGDTVGELAIISENGGANIATIGKYTTNVNNTFSLYTTASVETNRIHSNGDSFFNGGNVGIGTASPVAKLHVGGAFISNYLWTDTSGVSYWGTYPSSYGVLTWGSGYAHVYATTGNNLRLGANGSNIHMFISASGIIGIGTSTPEALLHVYRATDPSVIIGQTGTSAKQTLLTHYTSGGTGGNGYFSIQSVFQNNSYTAIVLNQSGGNVGIGTITPAYKLDVNGTARITSSVFLPGLTQVAQTNVVTINTSTGQLYFTASSAIGGGGLSGGTTNFVPLWTSPTTLGSSVISQSSANIGIGITPSYKLDIGGSLGIQNKLFAAVVGDYNAIYSPAGNLSLYLGGTTDPANYYYNTTHRFRSIAGTTNVIIKTGGAFDGKLGINVDPSQVFEASAAIAYAKFTSTTGTNQAVFQFTNSGGNFFLGMDNSTGTNFGGTIGYAGVVYHTGAYPIQFFTSDTLRMTLTSGGNLGIGAGTATTSYKLDVNASGATGARIFSGSLAVGNVLPNATIGRIDASNDVVAFSTSDIRFKTNLTPIDNALDKITTISGYEFDWIPNQKYHGFEGRDVGVIAQEIEKVLPQVVTTRDSGYKAVKYEKIVPLLIQAIKEQQTQIDELRYLLQNKT